MKNILLMVFKSKVWQRNGKSLDSEQSIQIIYQNEYPLFCWSIFNMKLLKVFFGMVFKQLFKQKKTFYWLFKNPKFDRGILNHWILSNLSKSFLQNEYPFLYWSIFKIKLLKVICLIVFKQLSKKKKHFIDCF